MLDTHPAMSAPPGQDAAAAAGLTAIPAPTTTRPRLDPPAAESPVWLPSLAQPKGSLSGPAAARAAAAAAVSVLGAGLTKTRHLPTGGNTLRGSGGDTSALFSMSTLPEMRKKVCTGRRGEGRGGDLLGRGGTVRSRTGLDGRGGKGHTGGT